MPNFETPILPGVTFTHTPVRPLGMPKAVEPKKSWLRRAWGFYVKTLVVGALGLTVYGHFKTDGTHLTTALALVDAQTAFSVDNNFEGRRYGQKETFLKRTPVLDTKEVGGECYVEVSEKDLWVHDQIQTLKVWANAGLPCENVVERVPD